MKNSLKHLFLNSHNPSKAFVLCAKKTKTLWAALALLTGIFPIAAINTSSPVLAAPLSCSNVYATGLQTSPSFAVLNKIYQLSGSTMTSVFTAPQAAGAIAVDGAGNAYYENGTFAASGPVYKYNGTSQSNTGRTWGNFFTGPGADSAGNLYYISNTYHLMKVQVSGTGAAQDLGLVGGDPAFSTLGSGDVAVDANGRIYVYGGTGSGGTGPSYLFSLDVNTLKATNLGNIGPNGASGLAFQGNTPVLVTTSAVTGDVFTIDLSASILTGTAKGVANPFVFDLGSCGSPTLNPAFALLSSAKTVVNITQSQTPAVYAKKSDILEYTIPVENTGNLPSGNTVLTDVIPTGTTYVAGTTTLNGVAVADVGGKMPYDPTSTYSREIHTAGQSNGVVLVGATNKAVVKFRVKLATSGLPSSIDNKANVLYPTVSGGVTTTQTASTNTVKTPLATPAKPLFVKRITAINGTAINFYEDDTTSTYLAEDNNSGWPTPLNTNPALGATTVSTFLKGKIDAGVVKPGDTVEYTIYFLNSGNYDADSVKVCDRIIGEQQFTGTTIQLQQNGAAPTVLTSAADTDRATFFATSSSAASGCNFKATPPTDNGAVVVNVTGSAGSPTWSSLAGSNGAGTTNSYGFVRFTTKVSNLPPGNSGVVTTPPSGGPLDP